MSRRSGLRDSAIPLVAGADEILSIQGNYFRLSEATYPVIVEIEGQDVFKLKPGEDVVYPVEDEFARIVLKTLHPVGETVTVTVGRGVKVGSVSLSGSVSINGVPEVEILGNLDGITGNVKTIEQPIEYGAAYKSATTTGLNAPSTVVSPAANVNGLIIHDFTYTADANGTSIYSVLIAKNSAPTSIIDGDVLGASESSGGSQYSTFRSKRPIKVPAGKGLYFISNKAENQKICFVLYTLI